MVNDDEIMIDKFLDEAQNYILDECPSCGEPYRDIDFHRQYVRDKIEKNMGTK